MFGIELIGLPGGNDVLEAELRGVTVRLHMVFVLPLALDVHVAGVPVAVLGSGLRSPVRPDTELGVSVPGRNLPGPQRFTRTLERPRRDLQLRAGGSRALENGRCADDSQRLASGK